MARDNIPPEWLAERIIACQSGSRRARRLAHDELGARLWPVLLRMAIVQQRRSWLATYSMQLAEDAAMFAYAQFLERIQTLHEPGNVMIWFRVVIRNHIISESRSRARTLTTDDIEVFFDSVYTDHVGGLSIAARLRELVEGLPPKKRKLIYQRFWQEMTFTEMANERKVTHQAVKGNMRRILVVLRQQLLKSGYEPDFGADGN